MQNRSKIGKGLPIAAVVAIVISIILAVSGSALYYNATGYLPFTNPPQPSGSVSCGSISSHGSGQVPFQSNYTSVMQCFYNAWVHQSQNVSMTLYFMGVDTGATHNLTLGVYRISPSGWSAYMIRDNISSFVNVMKQPQTATLCRNFTYGYSAAYNSIGWSIYGCINNETLFVPGS